MHFRDFQVELVRIAFMSPGVLYRNIQYRSNGVEVAYWNFRACIGNSNDEISTWKELMEHRNKHGRWLFR